MKFASLLAHRRGAAAFLLALSALAGALLFFLAPTASSDTWNRMSREWALEACGRETKGDIQTECIFRLLTDQMKNHSVGDTFEVFTQAYERYPEFVSGGCHRQAHRVGDLAYFQRYVGQEDLDAIDLPQSTTACGYGFYHGFMEHLIQDNPRPEFVDEVCGYLTKRLGETMGSIRITCYHGAGHGFEFAHIENLKESDWGNFKKFSETPAAWCRQMKDAQSADVQQCLEGIFNVLVDNMEINQYGFRYNYEHPFLLCDTVNKEDISACYYEMSQKLDRASGLDPVRLDQLANQGIWPELRVTAFRVGIAGVVQQVIVKDGYGALLDRCGVLTEERFTECLQSTINGLFEHGLPQEEYKKALDACEQPIIGKRGKSQLCYTTVAVRLPRFYGNERIAQICPDFPDVYRPLCEEVIVERTQQEPRTSSELKEKTAN